MVRSWPSPTARNVSVSAMRAGVRASAKRTMTSSVRARSARIVAKSAYSSWSSVATSIGVQVVGLFGAHGIAPATTMVAAARRALGDVPSLRFPTVFWWIAPTDAVLVATCVVGGLLAVAVAVGVAPRAALVVSWVLY